jgi:hypothetical protein
MKIATSWRKASSMVAGLAVCTVVGMDRSVEATEPLTVTSITLSPDPKEYTGPCPGLIKFQGTITATGHGALTYRFARSDGAIAPIETLSFNGPGTKTVESSWYLGAPYDGWQSLMVLTPTPLESAPARFDLKCSVIEPTASPSEVLRATAVDLVAEPQTYKGPCPTTIRFRGTVDIEGEPGTVTYRFTRSDGATGAVEALAVAIPGKKTVVTRWTVGDKPGEVLEVWQKLWILGPVAMESRAAGVRVECD